MFLRVIAWSVGLFLAIALALAISYPVLYEYHVRSETNYWHEIISHIEKFAKTYGRVPDPEKQEEVLSVGLKWRHLGCPQYELRGPSNYILRCYFGFDGPEVIYYSQTNLWRRECHQAYGCDEKSWR